MFAWYMCKIKELHRWNARKWLGIAMKRVYKITASAIMCMSLTTAASASQASLMKWSRTRRSQMGRNGEDRPGRVQSSTISSKAKSPDTHRRNEDQFKTNSIFGWDLKKNTFTLLLSSKRLAALKPRQLDSRTVSSHRLSDLTKPALQP